MQYRYILIAIFLLVFILPLAVLAEDARPLASIKKGKAPAIEMVEIAGGCYQMGSPVNEEGRGKDEQHHKVCVKDFLIGKYEVTQKQWQEVMGSNPSAFKGCDDCPVEQVSWLDVINYIEQLNNYSGKKYRLPTEAEWEYAARAGTTTPFSFKGEISSDKVNYNGKYTYGGSAKSLRRKKTVPVGSLPANPWGLHEMHGNVWELTCSRYEVNYSGREQRCVAQGGVSRQRSMRGGSWQDAPKNVRSAKRDWGAIGNRHSLIGFRLAHDQEN